MNATTPSTGQPPQDLIAAMQRLRQGDNRGALERVEAALPETSEPAPYLALGSLAALRLGEPARAIPLLRKLLETHPDDHASRANLANALVETGDPAGAIAVIEGSDGPGLARIEGVARQQLGDPEGAAAAYRRALAAAPNDAICWNNFGNALAQTGRYDEAIESFERAITLAPRETGIYLNLADVLRRADRGAARLKVARDAAAIAPDDRAVLTELAMAHAHVEELDAAIAVLEDVVERFPEFGESHIELGRLYEALNRVDDMAALVARIDRATAPPEAAFLFAWQAQRENRFDDAAELAQSIPETIHPMRRLHLVGSIAERRGDSAAAFAAFEAMNAAALADAPAQSGPTFRETIERDLARWTEDWRDGWRPVEIADGMRDPIFLVGFPRSGTTLLDTMLMGQPELSVLEERPMIARLMKSLGDTDPADLSSADIAKLRGAYFDAARGYGWDDARWLVDKHPLNMVRAPLIHRLFPRARFILAERHPCDVVLSCFMANFQLNFAMRSFASLEEAARTYVAVFSAWERARALLPIEAHPVRYERLVEDTRAELEPLVEWLGLDWHDNLLAHTETAKARGRVRTASYSQIGEKLYTRASGRWRRYAERLEPAMPLLAPWAERMGYETA